MSSEQKLARVIWQAAKFLVSLLEREYGLKKNTTGGPATT